MRQVLKRHAHSRRLLHKLKSSCHEVAVAGVLHGRVGAGGMGVLVAVGGGGVGVVSARVGFAGLLQQVAICMESTEAALRSDGTLSTAQRAMRTAAETGATAHLQ